MKSQFITVIGDYIICLKSKKATTVAIRMTKVVKLSMVSETLSVIHPDSEVIESTSHELESKASAAGWAVLRSHILAAVTEMAAMPLSQICLLCQFAFYRCQQCGSLGFYCQDCFLQCHSSVNIFHVPKKWEVTVRLFFVTMKLHAFQADLM